MNENTITTTSNVTLDDVRMILKDTDPFSTSASKIRSALGRGSNATIQKYLEQIRAEQVDANTQTRIDAPRAPSDVIQALWSSAWTAAHAHVSNALSDAHTETAQYRRERDIALSDMYAALNASDTAAQMLDAERQSNQSTIKERDTAIAKQVELQKEIDSLKHTLELRDAGTRALQSEIDRLVSNLADLRASLQK